MVKKKKGHRRGVFNGWIKLKLDYLSVLRYLSHPVHMPNGKLKLRKCFIELEILCYKILPVIYGHRLGHRNLYKTGVLF